MAALGRWLLFAASMLSLVIMTFAGVLLAYSVSVTDEMLEANRDLPPAGRAIVEPIADPSRVATHATGGSGAFLVAGSSEGKFPASAPNVSLRRALAFVAPVNGSYDPATLALTGVPSANGTSNYTIDVNTLAQGGSGWIVMGSGEDAPRFVAQGEVFGEAARFVSGYALGATFALGFLGFVGPLVGLVATHKAPRRQSGTIQNLCGECGAPVRAEDPFCMRCGALRGA